MFPGLFCLFVPLWFLASFTIFSLSLESDGLKMLCLSVVFVLCSLSCLVFSALPDLWLLSDINLGKSQHYCFKYLSCSVCSLSAVGGEGSRFL